MSAPLFAVQDLRITFHPSDQAPVTAVDGIDFSIFPGETLGVVGESGSGKTLSALALIGLLPEKAVWEAQKMSFQADSSATPISLFPNSKFHAQLRGKSIGMVFQEPMTSLNPVMRCGDQIGEVIEEHLGIRGTNRRKRVLEWLEKVKLDEPERIYRSYPHQLSGGQKQRVMIALALCCEPALLIADEPTTALDVTVQRHILALLKSLQQELGTTIVFISHDLGVIAEVADRVIIMQKGKIVEENSVDQLFTSPQHPYTRALLACRPKMDAHLRRLPTIQDFIIAEGQNANKTTDEVLVRLQKNTHPDNNPVEEKPLIQVNHLSTWFVSEKHWWGSPKNYVKAVDDVSFSVKKGKTTGLVGESGSGKTTLGRSILRLIAPKSGSCLFAGEEVMAFSETELLAYRKKAQIIFQDPYASLNPRLPIGLALMEPLRVHGLYASERERREQVDQLLIQVGLEPTFFDRLPHEFSGGQRQRIGIARALAVRPELIVCDECVSALDVSVQAQVLNLLKDLQEIYGLTYLFISHDLSVVKFMSDDILIMQKGQLVEQGSANAIFQNPQTEYTKQLIFSIPGKNL